MQWYDERLDGPIKEQDFRRNPPTSPPWRQQNPNYCSFKRDHDHGGNDDLSVGELDYGGQSTRSSGSTGNMVGEGDLLGAAGNGGGEGNDTAVLRSLEKVLAKQSANQRRRPSKEVRYIMIIRSWHGDSMRNTHTQSCVLFNLQCEAHVIPFNVVR